MWSFARSAARADRAGLAGTVVVLLLAGALLSATGVLMESGLRAGAEGGTLNLLAGSFAGTALMVVVLVVASTSSLAMRRRRRDFALLRAVGATTAQLRRLVALESLLVTAVAAPLGAVPGLFAARLLEPALVEAGAVPAGFELSLSPVPVLVAPLLLLPVVLVASRFAARETLRVPPTEAVQQSAVEPRRVGGVRRVSALVLAVGGLSVAFTPLVVPGTIGAAGAATAAFLLVGAAALAGPVIVAWLFERLARVGLLAGRPTAQLAVANTRGFSRRLTTAIVPLALVLAVGTVQTSVDTAVGAASARQLEAGLGADLVVTDPAGLTPEQLRAVGAVEGVRSTVALSSAPAQVRTDDEEVPLMEGLSWEPVSLRGVPADVGSAYDPGVVDGALADLQEPDTIALSTDARFETGKGLGDEVALRYRDGGTRTATVVAVFERGLGFGGYLVGDGTLASHDGSAVVDTVLVTGSPSALPALDDLGLTATTTAAYVNRTTGATAGSQHLSTLMTLLLLVFVGVAAANILVMTTAGRREELRLLRLTGATRRQLGRMAVLEALITAGVAWAIGVAASLPAVLGVDYGLLGSAVPTIDGRTFAVLSLAILATALLTVVGTALRLLSEPRAGGVPRLAAT